MKGSLSFVVFFALLGCAWCGIVPFPPFNCGKLPAPPPATNVRQLRFGNIKAVLALGDSISAGFAMNGYPPADLVENRDYVFSIGGVDGWPTIPNWLRTFNPNLQGVATSWTWPMTKGEWLDGAISMAKVEGLPDQIAYLARTLKSEYPNVKEDDWKLLTLFIGANNICGSCRNDSNTQPSWFESHLRTALQLIQKNIPRTFVNLIAIFNISGVWDAGQTKEYCKILWDGITNHECFCLTTGKKADREVMDGRSIAFDAIMLKVAAEFQNQNDPNFTVVVQPGISGLDIGYWGEDYLSNLDCFHPNAYANEAFTYAIWNNMQEPQGHKNSDPDPKTFKIHCPTQDTFIQ